MSSRKRLYIDMDDVLCDYTSDYLRYKNEFPNTEHPQSIPGFFKGLKPVEGALDAVNTLREAHHYDIYVLTAPSTKNVHSYSEKRIWIEKYFDYDFTRNLIICGHKNLLVGEYLIDDNVDGNGQEEFEGFLIHFGSTKFPNWDIVLQYLREIDEMSHIL